MATANVHASSGDSMNWFIKVWIALLVLTAIEVYLGYKQLELHLMIAILMGISILKSALIVGYFMHLRYERRSLFLTLIPALIFIFAMMSVLFPDSIRLQELRLH